MEAITNFFDYTKFSPKDREHVSGGESTTSQIVAATKNFFIDCHNDQWAYFNGKGSNLMSITENLLTTTVIDQPSMPSGLQKFLDHHHGITIDPFAYARGKQDHSLARRAFDLVLAGPLAGIIDAVASAAHLIFAVLCIPIVLIDWARGVDGGKENVGGCFATIGITLLSTVRCALRIAPIVGPFLGYGFTILSQAAGVGLNRVYNALPSITSQSSHPQKEVRT